MKQTLSSTKEKRMEIRLSTEEKNSVTEYCDNHHCTSSEFIREVITEKLQSSSEYTATDLLLFKNKIYNLTLAFPTLPKNYLKLLEEEFAKYE